MGKLFWTVEKLNKRLQELSGARYREAFRLPGLFWKEDETGELGAYPDESGNWQEVEVGSSWSGYDRYRWLAADVSIPEKWRDRKIVGLFEFGKISGNSGFESMLFLNGQPYQGVDRNHTEVFLDSAFAGSTVALRFRLWSGLSGYTPGAVMEHKISRASLAWLDEAADDLYYTGRAVLETVEVLSPDDPIRSELLSGLDRAFRFLDWSEPGSDSFYSSVEAAQESLHQSLSILPKHHPVTIRCIGHTHIDVAWLWRLRHTREKAARSFATVLRLMEQDPDYVFLQTQPQLYEYLKEDYPELYGQIQKRVTEGRWEAGGAMWLEADCNLTSGESLVRQLLYGIRFLKQEFHADCNYLWLPDVFGYSWALPQILKKSGIEAFMTTKISWNQYNRMPHDTFRWRGIDGSEVLTHFITTPEPGGNSIGAFYYTYNGGVTPFSIDGIWKGYRDKEVNKELLLAYGYGDGGGGTNREMIEMRRRLADMPGLPQVTTGRVDDYFHQLRETVDSSDRYVHTWDGELYLELHRGTYTSQAYNKRANRKLELLYREAEWLSSLHSLLFRDWSVYEQEELYRGWKIILRNQFHDIIPGSSIHEVYEDSRLEYEEAFRIGDRVRESAATALVSGSWIAADDISSVKTGRKSDTDSEESKTVKAYFTAFNGASWERGDILRIPAEAVKNAILAVHGGPAGLLNPEGCWEDLDGRELVAQFNGTEWLVNVPSIPSLGMKTVSFIPSSGSFPPAGEQNTDARHFSFGLGQMSTPFYEIEWNEAGQLVRIYDKESEREVLESGSLGNVLQVFEDKPFGRHEAWDIDIFYQEKMRVVDKLNSAVLEETGPLRAVVCFQWSYRNSTITQRLIAYADSRRIDFETEVDWHERKQLLKAAFPVQVRATEATYDIQFGNVKRPTHWNTSWDYARFETVGHQWADLSERGYGVSLLNDCKYGYDIKDNVLRLSLIKSATVPDPSADQGEHRFTYSLLPHSGDWVVGSTVREAWALNNPLTWIAAPQALPEFSLFRISQPNLMVDAVKKTEDGSALILRLHEFTGNRGSADMICGLPAVEWQECDLLERPEQHLGAGDRISFSMKPYEIKTFRISFS